MMPLITEVTPENWEQLENFVVRIFTQCGFRARRDASLPLPRGSVDVDVIAEETVDGITRRTICECKKWRARIPKNVVHAFRTVMQETGSHHGFIISTAGFQAGAKEAAQATNINLVTFPEFQNLYFDRWINKRIWEIEHEIEPFNVYYEPLGRPGYGHLRNDQERFAYDAVWNKYLFAGLLLMEFSPYLRMLGPRAFPGLPIDVTNFERQGVVVPEDIRAATGYLEFLNLLTGYARAGLKELRAVNPLTRVKAHAAIERED